MAAPAASRETLEHSGAALRCSHAAARAEGITSFRYLDIALLAHELWEARGGLNGSPQQDWLEAARSLTTRLRMR
jgi:hypothetical protein